jgi:hypothetical protein
MTDSIEFCEVTADEEAVFLMPGQSQRFHLVLFCEPGSPTVEKAQALVSETEVPEQWRFVHLDPHSAPKTAQWFGLSDQMGMAAIFDGALLAVEYECSLEAFRRLLGTARQQHALLKELG